jgi:The GLUG motif.
VESSSVSKSYATGNVEGASNVGGFVGFMQYASSVSESYSIGDVKGFNMIGGFVGSI